MAMRRSLGSLFGHHDFEGLFALVGSVFFLVHGADAGGGFERGRRVVGNGFVGFVEADADNLADALFLHGDAVEDVGHADRALVVRDDDELRMSRNISRVWTFMRLMTSSSCALAWTKSSC